MEIKAICQECGKEYDNFMRTFKVKTDDKELTVCRDCQNKYIYEIAKSHNKTWFLPHIPAFCDGGDLTLRIFKNIKDFTDFLNTIPSKKEKIVYDDKDVNTIMTIDNSGKNWWVHGYTNVKLKELGYEYWENCAIKEKQNGN